MSVLLTHGNTSGEEPCKGENPINIPGVILWKKLIRREQCPRKSLKRKIKRRRRKNRRPMILGDGDVATPFLSLPPVLGWRDVSNLLLRPISLGEPWWDSELALSGS